MDEIKMTSIKEREELLFAEWENLHPADGFIRDGVVDEKAYHQSKIKLLFLLKEPNDDRPSPRWDLVEDVIKIGERPQTWSNITRWTRGIHSLDHHIDWKEIEEISVDERKERCAAIAAMNLKKVAGGHTCSNLNLWEYVERYSQYIKKQILLYDADYIICGGTEVWRCALSLLPFATAEAEKTPHGVAYKKLTTRAILVSHAHPQARVADNLLYYPLIDAIRYIESQRYSILSVKSA